MIRNCFNTLDKTYLTDRISSLSFNMINKCLIFTAYIAVFLMQCFLTFYILCLNRKKLNL